MNLTLGLGLPYGAAGAPFDPLSLGPTGFWLPEPAFLFEEEDGTGAVTATEAVGYMADQGSGGNHLVQSTAAARPTYQTSGGLHWLQSASNDWLGVARALTQSWDRVSAWRIITLATGTSLAGGGNPDNNGTLYTSTGEIRLFDGAELSGPTVPAEGVDFVITERHAGGAASRVAIDNDAYVTGSSGTGETSFLTLFAGTGGTAQFIVARCYGIIERDTIFSDGEIAQLRTYFGARQGRSL